MKVQQNPSSQVSSTETSSTKQASRTSDAKRVEKGSVKTEETSDKKGNVEISSRAKELAQAKELASSAPDVRVDRVAQLKKQIAEGNYHVSSEDIADRMVEDHLRTADFSH
jgi:negative regulator of flagellin synthesis FlgM